MGVVHEFFRSRRTVPLFECKVLIFAGEGCPHFLIHCSVLKSCQVLRPRFPGVYCAAHQQYAPGNRLGKHYLGKAMVKPPNRMAEGL